MLMAAATAAAYMQTDSTHSSAGSTISPPPWHPAVAVPVATHQQHHQAVALLDPDLVAAPSPSPSPPRPRSTNNHHQQQLIRPTAARRASSSRRRPRPSRKVPTTYIAADPASFRRMVHQVTGAHDLPPPPPLAPRLMTHEATTLCRPAPTRATAAGGALPTLDTSALLLGSSGAGSRSSSTRRTATGLAASPVRPTPAAAASEVDLGAGAGVGLGGAGYGGDDCGAGAGGFPTLESWDALLY